MSKQLVKIHQKHFANGELIQTINARDLHAFLEVGKDFSTWIKVQIDRARLVENCDFVVVQVLPQKGENSKGGRPSMEYHLTLDAGKHISMMSNTDKGFEVRDYFIECERQAKQVALKLPATYVEALEALLTSEKKKQAITNHCNRITQINEHLQERLGEASKSATVLAVQIKTKKTFDWKPLKNFCTAQEIERSKVHDPRYGTVWSYPAEAWQHVYGIDLSVLFATEAAVSHE